MEMNRLLVQFVRTLGIPKLTVIHFRDHLLEFYPELDHAERVRLAAYWFLTLSTDAGLWN